MGDVTRPSARDRRMDARLLGSLLWEDDVLHCHKCGAETVRERMKVTHYSQSDGTPQMLSLRTCPNRRWPFDGHMREWTHAWPAGGEPDPRRLSSYG